MNGRERHHYKRDFMKGTNSVVRLKRTIIMARPCDVTGDPHSHCNNNGWMPQTWTTMAQSLLAWVSQIMDILSVQLAQKWTNTTQYMLAWFQHYVESRPTCIIVIIAINGMVWIRSTMSESLRDWVTQWLQWVLSWLRNRPPRRNPCYAGVNWLWS